MNSSNASYLTELHQLLDQHFSPDEIEALCASLEVELESAPAAEKESQIRALLLTLGRDGRLPELIDLVQQERPQVGWPPTPPDFELPPELGSGSVDLPAGQYQYDDEVAEGDGVMGDRVMGDRVGGDKVGGDKYTLGDVSGGAVVAVGAGATAVYQGLSTAEVAALVVELKRIDQPTVWDGRIPYLGLKAFQESDAEFFFGREDMVDDLVERVEQARFIVIAGPSGSGKSSVARAGLFRTLRAGRLDRSDNWLLAPMHPKGNPVEQLADAMARLAGSPAAGDHIRQNGLANPLSLHEQVEALLTDDARQRCVLLVDQFEETFTQTKDENVRAAFVNLLTTAAQVEGGRSIIVIALRADFVSNCALYPELRSLMSKQFQLVGAMDPQDLAEAITLPSLEVGAEIEAALVSRIINDMKGEPGALPLMSFALRDIFEAEKTAKGEAMDLTLKEYLERGGIERALERHADQVFKSFTAEQQELARGIFPKLIEVGQGRVDTRRTAVFEELIPAGASENLVASVVAKLAEEDVRLITTSSVDSEEGPADDLTGSQATVTIAHEKLIDAWPWLRQLVDENREIIALQNQINSDAQLWDEEQDAGYLYKGGRLIQVEERLEEIQPSLDTLSRRFIQASIDDRQREIDEKEAQRRRTIVILAGAAAVALVLAAVALVFFLQSNQNARDAQENLARAEIALTAESVAANEAQANLERSITREAEARSAEATAEAERDIAESQSLASQSSRYYDDQYDLSLLLSVAARQAADTLEARAGQLGALAQNPNIARYGHEHDRPVTGVVFSPDGNLLASADASGQIVVRNVSDFSPLLDVVSDHSAPIGRLLFSPDGSRLVTASFSDFNTSFGPVPVQVKVWDLDSGEKLADVAEDVGAEFGGVAFSPDARHAAFMLGNRIVLWDLDANIQLAQSDALPGDFKFNLAFQGDSDRIFWQAGDPESNISGSAIVGVWDVARSEIVYQETLEGHSNRIEKIVSSPDGQLLATVSYDGRTVLNDPSTGSEIASFRSDFSVWSVTIEERGTAFSQDGSTLALGNGVGEIFLYGEDGGWEQEGVLNGHSGDVLSLAFSPSGDSLVSGGEDGKVILWNLDQRRLRHAPAATSIVFDRGGDSFAALSGERITVFDTATLQPLAEFEVEAPITRLWEFTPDGEAIIASDYPGGGTAYFLDARTGEEAGEPISYGARLSSINLSADGQHLASAAGRSGVVLLHDMGNQQQLDSLTNDSHTGAAFSPDGSILATGTRDGKIYLWNTDDWTAAGEPIAVHQGWILAVAFSPDGKLLATAGQDRAIQLWDFGSGQMSSIPLFGHKDWIRGLAFSPDGSVLASAGDDDSVLLWDTVTGRQIGRLDTGSSELMFNPDPENWLLANGDVLWDLNSDSWPEMACEVANRNLSRSEWNLFFASSREYELICPDLPIHPSMAE